MPNIRFEMQIFRVFMRLFDINYFGFLRKFSNKIFLKIFDLVV